MGLRPTWSDAPVQHVEVVPVHQAVDPLCTPGSGHAAQEGLLGRGQLGVLQEEGVKGSCVSVSRTYSTELLSITVSL